MPVLVPYNAVDRRDAPLEFGIWPVVAGDRHHAIIHAELGGLGQWDLFGKLQEH